MTDFIEAQQSALLIAPKQRVQLTEEERNEVESLWGRVWTKPSYEWHEHYKAVTGTFDARYMPADVFYLDILPKLSDLSLANAWADKAYYSQRFPEAPFPALLFACINGRLVDADLKPIDWACALDVVYEHGEVFAKPSIGSYQGLGAFKINAKDVSTPEELKAVFANSGENYVVQELIQQADLFASFNSSSVNIIRMNTVWLDEEPFLVNATIRFGAKGQITDVAYIDGVETTHAVGIGPDGCLRDFYCNQDGDRRSLVELGVFTDAAIPGFSDAVSTCLGLHRQMHHFGIAAFDVAICGNDKPVIVEINLSAPGTVFYQYTNGPFFGSKTEEPIAWCENCANDFSG